MKLGFLAARWLFVLCIPVFLLTGAIAVASASAAKVRAAIPAAYRQDPRVVRARIKICCLRYMRFLRLSGDKRTCDPAFHS